MYTEVNAVYWCQYDLILYSGPLETTGYILKIVFVTCYAMKGVICHDAISGIMEEFRICDMMLIYLL